MPRPTSTWRAWRRSQGVVARVEQDLAERGDDDRRHPTTLLRAATPIGRVILGDGIAAIGRRGDPASAGGAAGDPRVGARGVGGRR